MHVAGEEMHVAPCHKQVSGCVAPCRGQVSGRVAPCCRQLSGRSLSLASYPGFAKHALLVNLESGVWRGRVQMHTLLVSLEGLLADADADADANADIR